MERHGFHRSQCADNPWRCRDLPDPYPHPVAELHPMISVAVFLRSNFDSQHQLGGMNELGKILPALPKPNFLRVNEELDAEAAARLRRMVEYLEQGPPAAGLQTKTPPHRCSTNQQNPRAPQGFRRAGSPRPQRPRTCDNASPLRILRCHCDRGPVAPRGLGLRRSACLCPFCHWQPRLAAPIFRPS